MLTLQIGALTRVTGRITSSLALRAVTALEVEP
jgi:hypothetical protein